MVTAVVWALAIIGLSPSSYAQSGSGASTNNCPQQPTIPSGEVCQSQDGTSFDTFNKEFWDTYATYIKDINNIANVNWATTNKANQLQDTSALYKSMNQQGYDTVSPLYDTCTNDYKKCQSVKCTTSQKGADTTLASQIKNYCGQCYTPYLTGFYDAGMAYSKQALAGLNAQEKTLGGGNPNSGTGGSGGLSSGSLDGLALGGIMGMMAAAEQAQQNAANQAALDQALADQQGTCTPAVNSAFNGCSTNLDCTQPDAVNYSGCDSILVTNCGNPIASYTMPGTTPTTLPNPPVISATADGSAGSQACQAFWARYCNTSYSTGQYVSDPIPDPTNASLSQPVQVLQGEQGEGWTQNYQYCENFQAMSWCEPAGRQTCPTCTSLNAQKQCSVAGNQATCLNQNSLSTTASQVASCGSTDPLVYNSNYASKLMSAAASAQSLVRPVALRNIMTVNGKKMVANAAGMPLPMGKLAAARTLGAADGAGAGAGAFGGSPPASYAAASTAARTHLALSGGAARPTTFAVARGPASEVESQYGRSLFAVSHDVMLQRCQAGKLINCP